MNAILLNFHVFQIFLLYVCLYMKDKLARYRIWGTFVFPFFQVLSKEIWGKADYSFSLHPSYDHLLPPLRIHRIISLNLNFIRLFCSEWLLLQFFFFHDTSPFWFVSLPLSSFQRVFYYYISIHYCCSLFSPSTFVRSIFFWWQQLKCIQCRQKQWLLFSTNYEKNNF